LAQQAGSISAKEYKKLISKKSKYRNKKVIIDGIKFDSKKEANYYKNLIILKRTGFVIDFKLQPRFLLQEGFKKNGETYRPIYYIADFWVKYKDGTEKIIDTKGVKTQVYRLKKKLFEKRYKNLTIEEIWGDHIVCDCTDSR